jgi:hypothetical protein
MIWQASLELRLRHLPFGGFQTSLLGGWTTKMGCVSMGHFATWHGQPAERVKKEPPKEGQTRDIAYPAFNLLMTTLVRLYTDIHGMFHFDSGPGRSELSLLWGWKASTSTASPSLCEIPRYRRCHRWAAGRTCHGRIILILPWGSKLGPLSKSTKWLILHRKSQEHLCFAPENLRPCLVWYWYVMYVMFCCRSCRWLTHGQMWSETERSGGTVCLSCAEMNQIDLRWSEIFNNSKRDRPWLQNQSPDVGWDVTEPLRIGIWRLVDPPGSQMSF